MSEAPQDFLEHWPPEVAAAWARLRLPAPAYLILANERQALELRRYNQELQALSKQTTAAVGHPLSALVRAADGAQRVLESLQADATRLPALAGGWPGGRARRQTLAQAIAAQVQGAQLLLDGILESLHDAGAESLQAEAGDHFDPAWMRAVQRQAGPAGKVCAQLRPGWRSSDGLIRPADVVIGTDQESP